MIDRWRRRRADERVATRGAAGVPLHVRVSVRDVAVDRRLHGPLPLRAAVRQFRMPAAGLRETARKRLRRRPEER